jgi:hypothetical protein
MSSAKINSGPHAIHVQDVPAGSIAFDSSISFVSRSEAGAACGEGSTRLKLDLFAIILA